MTQNLTPDELTTQFNAAIELHTNGHLDEAAAAYEAILATDPGFSDALHLLGLTYHQRGNSAYGVELIEKAVDLKPTEAAYHSNAGSIYKSMGRADDAIRHLERAVELDPGFFPAHYNVAELYCDRGELARGEAAYRTALSLNATHPDIWTNLGLCLLKSEKQEEAEQCLIKALDLKADFSPALYGLAHLRELQGSLDEAKMLFRQSMKFGFDVASCLRRIATICQTQKEPEESIEFLQKLVEIGEGDANVYNNMALAYQDLEDEENEKASLGKALEINPRHVESLCNYAAYLNRQGKFKEAVEYSRSAIDEDPKCDIAYNNLGASYKGQSRLEDAIAVYKRAIEIRADRAEYFNNLALAQQYSGKIAEMEANYKEALRLDPNYATARANFGSALLNFGRLTEAKNQIDRALIIDSTHVVAWNNLARYQYEVGAFKESLRAYRRLLVIDPENTLGLASMAATQIIRDDIDDEAVYKMHAECAEKFEKLVEPTPHDPAERRRAPGEPLRVGFISGDFRTHSVAFFLESLFDALDQSQYAIYCYSCVTHKDDMTRRLESRATVWRDMCDHPDDAMAQRIRDDGIDILVDLAGYTAGNRAKVFAMRPAPVQVNWLGYPHSTGLTRMDFRIVDAVTDPEGVTRNSEKLQRIPGCFLCYRPAAEAPSVAPLPARENGYITFGSFNNITKLTTKSVELFSAVLKSVDGSKLILKSHQAADPTMQRRVLAKFEMQGIGADRISFLPKFPGMKEHLGAYGRVDVALDTYPYNGTTTTCEALWMGVPSVTLQGTRHASRVGASLLAAVGLSDRFVAESEADFVAKAGAVVKDLDGLAALRSRLRDQVAGSVLRDEARFARVFGEALRSMWESFAGV